MRIKKTGVQGNCSLVDLEKKNSIKVVPDLVNSLLHAADAIILKTILKKKIHALLLKIRNVVSVKTLPHQYAFPGCILNLCMFQSIYSERLHVA